MFVTSRDFQPFSDRLVVSQVTGHFNVVASRCATFGFRAVVKIGQYGSSEPITESSVLKFSHPSHKITYGFHGTHQNGDGGVKVFHLIENNT